MLANTSRGPGRDRSGKQPFGPLGQTICLPDKPGRGRARPLLVLAGMLSHRNPLFVMPTLAAWPPWRRRRGRCVKLQAFFEAVKMLLAKIITKAHWPILARTILVFAQVRSFVLANRMVAGRVSSQRLRIKYVRRKSTAGIGARWAVGSRWGDLGSFLFQPQTSVQHAKSA